MRAARSVAPPAPTDGDTVSGEPTLSPPTLPTRRLRGFTCSASGGALMGILSRFAVITIPEALIVVNVSRQGYLKTKRRPSAPRRDSRKTQSPIPCCANVHRRIHPPSLAPPTLSTGPTL